MCVSFFFALLAVVVQIIEVYRCVTCVCVTALCTYSLKPMHADKDVDDEPRKTMMRYPCDMYR